MNSRQPTLDLFDAKDVTHSGGRGEIFHDWFPYLEGFSSRFVDEMLHQYFEKPKHIIEPFAGVGTTPIALAKRGIDCSYCEVNPVLVELIKLKAIALRLPPTEREKLAKKLLNISEMVDLGEGMAEEDPGIKNTYSEVFGKSIYFGEDNFTKVLTLKHFSQKIENEFVRRFFLMACASSLLKGSLLRRAGDVRYKTKRELQLGIPCLYELVGVKIKLFADDLVRLNADQNLGDLKFIDYDAKNLKEVRLKKSNGVITSPPYLNGTNYIRNTKLELWFLGYLNTKVDLRGFRNRVITSAINDVSKASRSKKTPNEVSTLIKELEQQSYDARIPTMVASYFYDMQVVANSLKHRLHKGAIACIDIGDSVYNGVHVPTHEILSDIFCNQGFSLREEQKLRRRFSNKGAELSQRLLVFELKNDA